MIDKIDISPEVVEQLAAEYDERVRLFDGIMEDTPESVRQVRKDRNNPTRQQHLKTAYTLRALAASVAELEVKNRELVLEVISADGQAYDAYDAQKAAEQRAAELEAENEKLRKGLEIYQRERDRFKHATPEMTGAYFLTGGHGLKDDNELPQFVEICPAYGCAWTKVYEDTGRTITYEGS